MKTFIWSDLCCLRLTKSTLNFLMKRSRVGLWTHDLKSAPFETADLYVCLKLHSQNSSSICTIILKPQIQIVKDISEVPEALFSKRNWPFKSCPEYLMVLLVVFSFVLRNALFHPLIFGISGSRKLLNKQMTFFFTFTPLYAFKMQII